MSLSTPGPLRLRNNTATHGQCFFWGSGDTLTRWAVAAANVQLQLKERLTPDRRRRSLGAGRDRVCKVGEGSGGVCGSNLPCTEPGSHSRQSKYLQQ